MNTWGVFALWELVHQKCIVVFETFAAGWPGFQLRPSRSTVRLGLDESLTQLVLVVAAHP